MCAGFHLAWTEKSNSQMTIHFESMKEIEIIGKQILVEVIWKYSSTTVDTRSHAHRIDRRIWCDIQPYINQKTLFIKPTRCALRSTLIFPVSRSGYLHCQRMQPCKQYTMAVGKAHLRPQAIFQWCPTEAAMSAPITIIQREKNLPA